MTHGSDARAAGPLAEAGAHARFPHGWLAWCAYDFGQRPYNFLILTYIFAPWFAGALYGDPVRGQAAWGLTVAGAGVLVALLAPALGAIADAAGPKKPWIAIFGAMLVLGSAALGFVRPGDPHAVTLAMFAVVVATIGSEVSIVFHNALMPLLSARNRLGELSGLGWAVGVLGGVATLLLVLAVFAVDPRTGLTLGGWAPPFAMDTAQWPAGRLVGPLVAFWFALFVLPMFIWMPDDRRSEKPLTQAARNGLAGLRTTIRELRGDRKLKVFLTAYLLCSDGIITLIAFGGVYASGLLDWGPIQLAGLGVVLGVVGVPVLLVTGRLDDAMGPRRVVTICIGVLIIATICLLGVDKAGIFGMSVEGLNGGHFFLFCAIAIGLSAGPLQSSSRTLLAHLAPRDRITQMFGLLALSGRVSSFAGPALVAVVTAITGSQRLGLSVALIFLVGGGVLMLRLRKLAPD